MKRLVAVQVLLVVVTVSRADEEGVCKTLMEAGVKVRLSSGSDSQTTATLVSFDGVLGTDTRLGDLCELRKLDMLSLIGSDVTDAGMATVGGFKGLKFLKLNHTTVTDTGLRRLEGMGRLDTLDLTGCPHITDAGVARLQKALPQCKIYR
jgi:hypothetical protein